MEIMFNTQEEIDFLIRNLKPTDNVLEWGSGGSTLLIAKHVAYLTSIEHDEKWYDKVGDSMKVQMSQFTAQVARFLIKRNREEAPGHDGTEQDYFDYVHFPESLGNKFDVIFIDGRARPYCAKVAVSLLKPGGIILIHDIFHPNEKYTRHEYDVVLEFLDRLEGEFTIHKFMPKTPEQASVPVQGTEQQKRSAFSGSQEFLNTTNVELDDMAEKVISEKEIMSQVKDVLLQTELEEVPVGSLPADQAGTSQQPVIEQPVPVSVDSEQSAVNNILITEKYPEAELLLQPIEKVDTSTCWYSDDCVKEMNRFFDIHIKNFDLTKHLAAFTSLLQLAEHKGEPVIDLGCGTAMLSEFCKEHRYFGADLPHIISGCAMRNYPDYMYRKCDLVNDDLSWIKPYPIVIVNGVIDIMQYPLQMLRKVLLQTSEYLIIHRQEITEAGPSRTIRNKSYNSETFHSIINRDDFNSLLENVDFEVVKENQLQFGNWENGGSSFLLRKRKSWSLHQMDHKLKNIMGAKREGFFIEAGANDGLRQSNTMFFEFYKNWKGILIEPSPTEYHACRENRSIGNIYVEAALVDPAFKGKKIDMIYTPGSHGLLTVVNDDNAPAMMKRALEPGREFRAATTTLEKILREHEDHLPKVIDLMVLDLEGYELAALKGIDFKYWNISWLLIEQLDPENMEIQNLLEPWYSVQCKLSENDYLYRRRA